MSLPAPSTVPPQHLLFLTNRVGRQLATAVLADLEFEGFRPQGIHVGLIADLVTEDEQRQQDLALSTIKDKGSVARALAVLENEGMVSRRIDPSDRRQKIIRLTPRGRALWCRAERHAQALMDRVTHDLSSADLRLCTRVLAQLHQNLHNQLSSTPNE